MSKPEHNRTIDYGNELAVWSGTPPNRAEVGGS
jgi:hypothetical protein